MKRTVFLNGNYVPKALVPGNTMNASYRESRP